MIATTKEIFGLIVKVSLDVSEKVSRAAFKSMTLPIFLS